ncbi:hypothetical protein [Methanosarcina sp. KYL-1]|uniref:hypothetical protein n=1 Tax=Methanosarcina sp. KYL-1 TaxID=2602068 RepID=UPI0021011DF8|nr:hypothetical protein [Methanosarcina sp. KYL-1]
MEFVCYTECSQCPEHEEGLYPTHCRKVNEDIRVNGAMLAAERVEKYWDTKILEQKSGNKV